MTDHSRSILCLCVCVLAFVLGTNESLTLRSDENTDDDGAKIAAYPYQASVEVKRQHLCGATIIDDFWVLTAQSCLRNLTRTTVKVRVGTNRLGYHGTLLAVSKAVNYTPSVITPMAPFPFPQATDNADLAMYKVKRNFRYKPSIGRLNIAEADPNEGDVGYITGWGKAKKKKGSVLDFAKVTVMPRAECETELAGLVNFTKGMSCVRSVNDVAKNCIADVGGPLLINHQLAGVVAYSPRCNGDDTKPVAVTNVGLYSSYVVSTLCNIIFRV